MTEERFHTLEITVAKIEAICEKVSIQLDTHTVQDNANFNEIKNDIKALNKTVTTLSVLQDADDKAEEKKESVHTTAKIALLSILATAALEGLKQIWSRLSGS